MPHLPVGDAVTNVPLAARKPSIASFPPAQSPTNFVNPPKIRPVLRRRHQPMSHRVFPHIPPFLRITLAIAQSMMKPTTLECPSGPMFLRESVFPKTHPPLDREFEIARCAKQMQVIRHQQIITHQPCCRRVLPNAVRRPLHGRLREPTITFLGTNGQKYPIRSAW
jgi:hypothetical protein